MDNDILQKAKLRALKLLSGTDDSPKGFGDVKNSEQDKSYGYQDPLKEQTAQQLHKQGMFFSQRDPLHPLAKNVTSEDIDQSNKLLASGMNAGMTAKIGQSVGGNINSMIQTPKEQLLDYIQSIPKTNENMPKIRAMLQKLYGTVVVKP